MVLLRLRAAARSIAAMLRCALALSVWTTATLACSTMALGPREAAIIAYSYDTSETGAGLIVATPANAHRSSIMEGAAAQWPVLYGSVTFTQFGPGMPAAGMNTEGLVVSLMWNDAVIYPDGDGAAVVNELEMIQMVLDRAGTVTEALDMLDGQGIQGLAPIHYFLADASGMTAAVLPTREGFDTVSGEEMPIRALTNTSYAELLAGLSAYEGFGGVQAPPSGTALDDPGSHTRFFLAARAASASGPATLEAGFDALRAVQNPQTHWQILFHPVAGAVTFQLVDRPGQWRIDMTTLGFSCEAGMRVADLAELDAGADVPVFRPVEAAIVEPVLREVLGGFAEVTGLPLDAAGAIAVAQMDALRCAE